jgi:hypothetical protein
MEDLSALYEKALNGETPELPPKTDSFKDWSLGLAAFAKSSTFRAEIPYWKKALRQQVPALPTSATRPHQIHNDPAIPPVVLNTAYTKKLLTEVNLTFNTHINEVLLTPLAQAVKSVFQRDKVWILLEGHGREEILPNIQLSRTVGWFTSYFPVLLNCEHQGDNGH